MALYKQKALVHEWFPLKEEEKLFIVLAGNSGMKLSSGLNRFNPAPTEGDSGIIQGVRCYQCE